MAGLRSAVVVIVFVAVLLVVGRGLSVGHICHGGLSCFDKPR